MDKRQEQGSPRRCRFCNNVLDVDHFFFCCEFCEECFKEDYALKTVIEREKLVSEVYKPI